MAVLFIQKRKIQKNLILVFLGLIFIITIIFWQGFLKEEKIIPQPILKAKKTIKIDFEILESPAVEELQPFFQIEPFGAKEGEEQLGRENPFLPF